MALLGVAVIMTATTATTAPSEQRLGTPKLLQRRTLLRRSIQKDEFAMNWEPVWKAYFYENATELDQFLGWFFENACSPPKQIAMEVVPLELLVCAKPCEQGLVPVLKHGKKGRRYRSCVDPSLAW